MFMVSRSINSSMFRHLAHCRSKLLYIYAVQLLYHCSTTALRLLYPPHLGGYIGGRAVEMQWYSTMWVYHDRYSMGIAVVEQG